MYSWSERIDRTVTEATAAGVELGYRARVAEEHGVTELHPR